jgi:hypothetical protein
MIYQIDIHTDRSNNIVHLKDEAELFWIIPIEDDGSNEWVTVQAWLDEGNVITDTLEYKTLYKGTRAQEYPDIGDQLDALFHAGVFPDAMAVTLQAVKDKYPKPE